MANNVITHSELETRKFGQELVNKIPLGTTVLLRGDLGAGKTTLVRGVAEAIGIKEKVTSPTFNIMKIYFKAKLPLIHIDAYRLENIDQTIGLEEYIGYEKGITLIEWPDYISALLPKEKVLNVCITNQGNDTRMISWEGDVSL